MNNNLNVILFVLIIFFLWVIYSSKKKYLSGNLLTKFNNGVKIFSVVKLDKNFDSQSKKEFNKSTTFKLNNIYKIFTRPANNQQQVKIVNNYLVNTFGNNFTENNNNYILIISYIYLFERHNKNNIYVLFATDASNNGYKFILRNI